MINPNENTANVKDWHIVRLDGAKTWFDISMYKGLAKRLIKEAQNFQFDASKTYYHADIERYCALNNIVLLGSIQETKRCCEYYILLKIGKYIFRKHRFTNDHLTYKIIETNHECQMTLF